MNLGVKLAKEIIDGREYYFMITSHPYECVGEAFWDFVDKAEIIDLIRDVEKTLQKEWIEPLPVEFASGVTTIFVYSDNSYVYDSHEKRGVIPTRKILLLLHIWLNFISFSEDEDIHSSTD
jgi:hypothetical protein